LAVWVLLSSAAAMRVAAAPYGCGSPSVFKYEAIVVEQLALEADLVGAHAGVNARRKWALVSQRGSSRSLSSVLLKLGAPIRAFHRLIVSM
jgi:hypothetical protein